MRHAAEALRSRPRTPPPGPALCAPLGRLRSATRPPVPATPRTPNEGPVGGRRRPQVTLPQRPWSRAPPSLGPGAPGAPKMPQESARQDRPWARHLGDEPSPPPRPQRQGSIPAPPAPHWGGSGIVSSLGGCETRQPEAEAPVAPAEVRTRMHLVTSPGPSRRWCCPH